MGTAGWSIPRQFADAFPAEGTALERYATVFPAVEINSSFHRPHRLSTWERWRDSVPEGFRFSVKLPKRITHQLKLVDCTDELQAFAVEMSGLGDKLAVILVQLPPKHAFDRVVATRFFKALKARTGARIVCEPRHLSWFDPDADSVLQELHIGRVAADPALCETAARPGGWTGIRYWRLHGSPVIYRSSYEDRIADFAALLEKERTAGQGDWCVFDNTASSAATGDALALMRAVQVDRLANSTVANG